MKTNLIRGNKYFLLFNDDHTTMCWVYVIRLESEVFDVFNQLKDLLENQCNLSINALKSDNRGEYTSS